MELLEVRNYENKHLNSSSPLNTLIIVIVSTNKWREMMIQSLREFRLFKTDVKLAGINRICGMYVDNIMATKI